MNTFVLIASVLHIKEITVCGCVWVWESLRCDDGSCSSSTRAQCVFQACIWVSCVLIYSAHMTIPTEGLYFNHLTISK